MRLAIGLLATGAAVTALGVWLIYPPAGVIVAGLATAAFGLVAIEVE